MTRRSWVLVAGATIAAAIGIAIVLWSPWRTPGADQAAQAVESPAISTPAATAGEAVIEPEPSENGEQGEECEPGAEEPGAEEPGAEGEPGEECGADSADKEAEEHKARDAWFMDQRLTADKKVPKGAWQRSHVQAAKLRAGAAALATDPLDWSQLGPTPLRGANNTWFWGGSTPYGGRVTAIANHPKDAKIAYVGTAMGGVWKTTDGGQNWTPIFDNIVEPGGIYPSPSIGAVAIDPTTPNTVYVGTGEANNTGGYFGNGLYRSTDGGGTWHKIGDAKFNDCGFSSIVVKNSLTVVVGVVKVLASFTSSSGTKNVPCAAAGIFQTTTGGTAASDWHASLTPCAPTVPVTACGEPNKIVVAPNSPNTLYAGMYGSGLYKSTNFGGGWAAVPLSPVPANPQRVEVAVVAAGSLSSEQAVYVAVAQGNELPRLYYSANSGTTWQTTSTAFKGYTPVYNGRAYPYSFCRGQCGSYDLVVAAHPSDPTQAYVGGVFLNGVSSLVPRLIGLGNPSDATPACKLGVAYTETTTCLHTDMHVLTFDIDGRLWVGSDGGVWRTSTPKATTPTFTNLNEHLTALMYYPGMAGTVGTQLLIGAQDNGAHRIAAGGSAGMMVDYGDGVANAIISTSLAFTSSQYGQIQRIKSDGSKCSDAYHGESGDDTIMPFVAPLVAGPTAGTAYAGGSYIWRTANSTVACTNEPTWVKVSSQQFTRSSDGRGKVNAIAPAKSGDIVYAGMSSGSAGGGGEVWVGTVSATWATGPTSWADRSGNLPNKPVTDFWVSPTNSQVAYLTMSGWGTGHVWKTTNGGTTWNSISGNVAATSLPDSPANAIVLDTRSAPAILYVGMDTGVFWSNDDGATWQNTSRNLPPTVVHDLVLDTTANQLIAATFGRGVWKAPALGSAPSGPANDRFAQATIATTLPFSKTGIATSTATTETGENLALTPCGGTGSLGKTVWFRYTPATDVTVTADTATSTFDTILTAFRGTALNTLVELACDDDGVAPNGASRIATLALTGGQTYYFQAAGYAPVGGTPLSGTLAFKLDAVGPANDAFTKATVIGSLPFSVSGIDTSLASTEANETTQPSCAGTGSIGKTLWFKYTPASNVTITADTANSSAGFDTMLVLYRGTAINALTEVGCDDDSAVAPAGGGASRITGAALTGGQTYYFQAAGFADPGQPVDFGTLAFRVSVNTTSNDAFASATAVSTFPFSVSNVSTSAATVEQGEDVLPTCTDGKIGKTLWYKLTPASNVNLTIDLEGSSPDFDTLAVLFSGTTLGALTEVACDDDAVVYPGSGGASRIAAVGLTGGQTYYLQVGGWQSTTGSPDTGTLSLKIGSIDAFASAGIIDKLPFSATGLDTTNAGTEAGENTVLLPCAGTGSIGKTVWFSFTPSANMTVTANTQGTSFDTVLTAFRGTSLPALTELACDDDGIAPGGASQIANLALQSGLTYYFQVSGYTEPLGTPASGSLVFNLVQN